MACERADPLPHRPDDELHREAGAAGPADERPPARGERAGARRLGLVELQLPGDLSQVARLPQLDELSLCLGSLHGVRPQPVDHFAADIEQRGHRIHWWDVGMELMMAIEVLLGGSAGTDQVNQGSAQVQAPPVASDAGSARAVVMRAVQGHGRHAALRPCGHAVDDRNLKTQVNGAHPSFGFARSAGQYRRAWPDRFDRRVTLKSVLHDLLDHAVAA